MARAKPALEAPSLRDQDGPGLCIAEMWIGEAPTSDD
jgi:hypothetical protein